MRLLIYHNVIAPYKVPFFSQIAEQFPGSVVLYTSSNFRMYNRSWGSQDIPASNLEIKRLPAINLPNFQWYNPSISYQVFREDFDLLFTGDYHFLSSLLATEAALLREKPTVLYALKNDYAHITDPSKSRAHAAIDRLVRYFADFEPLVNHTLPRYDACISPSKTTLEHLTERGVAEQKLHHIFDCVDTDKFNPKITPTHEFGIDELEGRKIVFVGRLHKEKGIDLLIDAMDLVDSNISLIVVGDGPLRDAIAERISTLDLGDRVRLVGRVQHEMIPHILASGDAFVLPSVPTESNVEQFPNALLEALSMGLPCVTFDIEGGISEIHIDGKTGTKADELTAESLAKAVDRLVHSHLEEYGNNARKRSVSEFSPDVIGKKYAELFVSIINNNN